jgi:hypothetical protein
MNTGEYKGEYPNFCLNVISKISGDPDKCLFDYQYNNSSEYKDKISSCEAQVKTNCFLHAMQSEVAANENEQRKPAAVHDRMLAFTFTQGKFWVFNGKEDSEEVKWENLKDKAWIVLNHVAKNKQSQFLKKDRYKLQDGDIVRFGRVVFKVSIVSKASKKNAKKPACEQLYEIVDKSRFGAKEPAQWESTKTVMPAAGSPRPALKSKFTMKGDRNTRRRSDSVSDCNSVDSDNSEKEGVEPTEEQDGEVVCRICYGKEEDELEDPLIEVCNCSGSVKMIHLSCAKAWINEELTQDIADDVKSYCWERISCELCHSNFKEVVYKDGRVIKLFEKEKIEAETYMVLESIYPDYIKIYFGLIIDKENDTKVFQLGRSRT